MTFSNKRGVAYTLAITFLGIVLLSLSLLIFNAAQSSQSQLVIFGATQKIYDLEQSIQETFAQAVVQKTTLRFSSTINSFTINETLPQNISALTDLYVKLEPDIERDFPAISLDTSFFIENKEFQFLPQGISYIQESTSKIKIKAATGGSLNSVQGYNLTLIFPANITTCSSNVQEGNVLQVAVKATSPGNSCIIPATSIQQLELQMVSEGKNFQLTVDQNKELTLDSQATAQSSLVVMITPLTEYGHLEIPVVMETNESSIRYYRKTNLRVPLQP